ncbi:PglD-related sugar-binding protein [Chitinolyticbacter meiyuanensis]|uniref:PglD-related sugar-binding protein n=1 Tax=Chitinolyticbacter meiyuanensis TaxID=682798 RepID=UPI0011E5D965|nr:acetyltransferase [Chitinolyticbacter meiyuanensis]
MNEVIVVGAGGHGRAVAEALLLEGRYRIAGFVDDQTIVGVEVFGLPILGKTDQLPELKRLATHAIVAIGNNTVRKKLSLLAEEAGFTLVTVVHPAAVVAPSAQLQPGVAVMSAAVVGTEAVLARGVILNAGAIADHHCRLDEFAHLGVGVHLAGGVHIGASAWLQAGSAAGYGVAVAPESIYPPGSSLKA